MMLIESGDIIFMIMYIWFSLENKGMAGARVEKYLF